MRNWFLLFYAVCAVLIVIHSVFEYLITKDKIKVSKFSKLFYKDDKSYINYWEKTEKRGMLIYTIKTTVFSLLYIQLYNWSYPSITGASIGIYKEYRLTWFILLIFFVMFLLFLTPVKWHKEKEKYNKIKNNMENGNINNTLKLKSLVFSNIAFSLIMIVFFYFLINN